MEEAQQQKVERVLKQIEDTFPGLFKLLREDKLRFPLKISAGASGGVPAWILELNHAETLEAEIAVTDVTGAKFSIEKPAEREPWIEAIPPEHDRDRWHKPE